MMGGGYLVCGGLSCWYQHTLIFFSFGGSESPLPKANKNTTSSWTPCQVQSCDMPRIDPCNDHEMLSGMHGKDRLWVSSKKEQTRAQWMP